MSLDKYIQDGQDLKVIEKVHGKISDMLMQNENIRYIALQKKPAVTLLPDSITITNKRIFLCEFTKLGLSTNFEIFSWKDIKDIAFKEEIFGSKVTVIPFTGENLSIDYIPKTQARRLFQLIKEALEDVQSDDGKPVSQPVNPIKEAPKPIVPIREIYEQPKDEFKEEVKPKAVESTRPIVSEDIPKSFTTPVIEQDNTYVAPSYPTQPVQPQVPESVAKVDEDDEITQKLKKLKNLYDKQLITQSEYESKKAEILSQL